VDFALIVAFVALGAVVGFLAGLLGLGGGMTMVPLLTIVFAHQGFATAHIVHLAVATATATILFTSIASAREHHRHGAVLWGVVAGMAPGMIVGSFVGPQIVASMSTSLLAAFFGAFVAACATQTLVDRKPKPTRELPGGGGLFAVGGFIGLISSMVGAGGAFLTVPFMAACNVDLRKCVATSAALGLPVAIAGTISFVLAGLGQAGLPRGSIGYVYVPALLAIVVGSVMCAPFGARAAHRWPVKLLRRGFACVLYVLAAYMLYLGFRDMGIPNMQLAPERAGYRLPGFAPGYNREMFGGRCPEPHVSES
jgi:uncharacterized membrane protein YfcA